MTKKDNEVATSKLGEVPLVQSKDRDSQVKRFTREEILNVYRDPLSDSSLFGIKDDENFVYYWPVSNDPKKPLRIESMKALGWEVVTSDMKLKVRGHESKDVGTSTVTRPAGGGKEHILMRMPRELYEERALKKELYLQLTADKMLGKRTKQNSGKLGMESVIDGGTVD